MRHSCFLKAALLLSCALPACAGPDSAAFFYGRNVPKSLLSAEWLVVDLRNLADTPPREKGRKLICYASAGEFRPEDVKGVPGAETWALGANSAWKTRIGDLRSPSYREYLRNSVIAPLKNACDGFFIDTLDSYSTALPAEEHGAYIAAAAAFLGDIKRDNPDKLLVLNRGFELLPLLGPGVADAVAAESLYRGFDPVTRKYRSMSNDESSWLEAKLSSVAASGIPVIVIDYLPPADRAAAQEDAARISAAGFTPYVSDMDLLGEGCTGLIPVKRRVLMVAGNSSDIFFSPLHGMAQLPLEYLGYDPLILTEDQVMQQRPAPEDYAGVIVWLEYSAASNPEAFRSWVMDGMAKGVKFLFVNSFGFNTSAENLAALGLSAADDVPDAIGKARITAKDPMCSFEAAPDLVRSGLLLRVSSGTPLITAVTPEGAEFHPAALMPWGGYAFYSSLISNPVGDDLWTIDPFKLLPAALGLRPLPAPDISTENGRRIFFSHIDGDGFIEPAEWDPSKIAAEVIRDDFIKKYPFPFTVSVIEGEISATGAYPAGHKRYERTARSIFALPNVEAASHSYSHPFFWGITANSHLYEKHNLQINDYVLDYRREIFGARDYVNSLLPAGESTRIFHWTGNCLPDAQQIALSREAGLLNINGGGSTAMNFLPWLSRMMPYFIERSGEVQVYAPIQNENVFTEGWKHPFYRFIQVMETIKLTGEPRRLKPINVYFHFFSGSKLSSVNALRKVYDWVSTLKTAPMRTSEWLSRAADFKGTTLAVSQRGSWLVRNAGGLRTLRAPRGFGVPDLSRSKGVAGYKAGTDGLYVHLDGTGSAEIFFSSSPASGYAYLEESSAILSSFKRLGRGFKAGFIAEAPGELSVAGAAACRLRAEGAKRYGNLIKFGKGTVELSVDCE